MNYRDLKIFESLDDCAVYRDHELESAKRRLFEQSSFSACNCGENSSEMALVHQGAFAAKKMREREEKFNASLDPMQYNTKFMDSIWGQYNRYSVHNLKKIMDSKIAECMVSPTEKIIPMKNEKKIFSADVGTSNPFTPKHIYN